MDVNDSLFSEYDYIKNTNSIGIRKKQKYVLGDFNSEEEIEEWVKNLPDGQKIINRESIILDKKITKYGVTILESELESFSKDITKKIMAFPKITYVTPYMPWVYRYIDEEFVDRFFETGEIRLCTFESCAKLEDSQRKDGDEGKAIIVGETSIKKLCIMGSSGENNLMLCSSMSDRCVNSAGELYKNGIIIKNVIEFMAEIKNALELDGVYVENMLMGPCNYAVNKRINRTIPDEVVKNIIDNHKVCLNDVANTFFSVGQNDIFFRKQSEKASEHEYRMLWSTEQKINQDHYTVCVPNAVKLCERFRID